MTTTLDDMDPDVGATYSIEWIDELVAEARRDAAVGDGVIVQPQRGTGFLYECTTPGRTSAYYPVWPRAEGETVSDGSVVWTARHPDDAATALVGSATWTVPAALTLVSQSESGFITSITLTGGEDGVDYELTCRMTPTVGTPIDQTIVIPVRSL